MKKKLLYLDTRRGNKNCPLKLIFRNGNSQCMHAIGISIDAENWDAKNQMVVNIKRAPIINLQLQQIQSNLESLLFNLRIYGKLTQLTAGEIKAKYLAIYEGIEEKNEEENTTLIEVIEKFSSNKNQKRKYCFDSLGSYLKKFDPNNTNINLIDKNYIEYFIKFLKKTSLKTNSQQVYFMALKSVIKYCIEEEIITKNPMRGISFKRDETMKRSLRVEDLRMIFNIVDDKNQIYLDIFKLIFLLIGINIKDLVYLKNENIENGRINYYRFKNRRLYSIKIEKEAQEIIDKYRGEKYMLNIIENRSFESFYNSIFRFLKASTSHICKNLTTYYARHSWATIASQLDISRDVIAEALGHRQTVTDIYINFDRRKIDKANRKVIDFVLYNKTDNSSS